MYLLKIQYIRKGLENESQLNTKGNIWHSVSIFSMEKDLK
jgi:hypothetical protein